MRPVFLCEGGGVVVEGVGVAMFMAVMVVLVVIRVGHFEGGDLVECLQWVRNDQEEEGKEEEGRRVW